MSGFISVAKPCIRCGSVHHQAERICRNCTEIMAQANRKVKWVVADIVDNLTPKFCVKCGGHLDATHKWCLACGKDAV